MRSGQDRLNRMARSGVIVAAVSALTLLLTIAWQHLIARTFGASADLDAFWVALAFPRAIAESFHLGLLTLLFVLVFNAANHASDADRWRQSSAVLNTTLLCTAVAIAVLTMLSSPLVRVMAPGLATAQQALAASLMRRLSFMLIATAAAAAIGGVAIAREDVLPFVVSRAAVPALQIATFVAVVGWAGIHALVWALWIGTAGSLLVFTPWARRVGFQYRFVLGLNDPQTRHILRLQVVLAVIWLLISLNQMSDRFFASLLGAGSVSALEFAWRFEIPISQIVSLAVALPTFAMLAQSASNDRREEFRATLAASARLLVLTVVPILGFLVVLREPLTRMWLERGAFSIGSVHAVASLLPALAPVYFCRAFAPILVFGLLIVGRTRLLVGGLALEVAANTVLNFLLSRAIGLPGIALASAISMLVVNSVLWTLLLREIGGLSLGPLVKQLRPIAVAAVAAIVGLELLRRTLNTSAVFDLSPDGLVRIAVIGIAYLGLYVAACVGGGLLEVELTNALPRFALKSTE